jgi:hypothetical protein
LLTEDELSFLNPASRPVIKNFIDLSIVDKRLDFKHIQILNFLLKNPGKTPKEVVKASLTSLSDLEYNTIRRYILSISDNLKLIEPERQELVEHMQTKYLRYYRLSLSGIFYVILNTFDISDDDPVSHLLKNYPENQLFAIFLYPFINKQTLIETDWDTSFFSIVSSYLKDISKTIVTCVKSVKGMSTSDDGYYNIHLLDWPINSSSNLDVPTSRYSNLRYFLKKTLKWDWIYKAEIHLKLDDSVIEIKDTANPENKPYIRIVKDEKKAILRQKDTKLYEFIVVDNDSFWTLEAKDDRKSIDVVDASFVEL